MHLLRQHQQYPLFCLFFILAIQTVLSVPIKESVQSIRCNILNQNCTFIPRNSSSSDSHLSSTNSQGLTSRTVSWPMLSTSRQRSTSKSPVSDFDAFSDNLKRAALILAGIALGLGILRICLMLCKSRSPNNSISNRHSAIVRPQISTIEHHQFKPDLPPEYAEAIANSEYDGGKLPTYDELPNEQQQQEQHVYANNGYISTQM